MRSLERPNGREYVVDNEEAIAELYLDALELSDLLKEHKIQPDCLIGRQTEVRKSIFRRKETVTESVEGWNMHGCEPAGIESLALSTDGIIYLNSVEPMYGGHDQTPVMPTGIELSDTHFMSFAQVDEISERLRRLSPFYVSR